MTDLQHGLADVVHVESGGVLEHNECSGGVQTGGKPATLGLDRRQTQLTGGSPHLRHRVRRQRQLYGEHM